MTTRKLIGLQVEPEFHERVERRAKAIAYRTITQYVRQLIEADLKKADKRKPAK